MDGKLERSKIFTVFIVINLSRYLLSLKVNILFQKIKIMTFYISIITLSEINSINYTTSIKSTNIKKL